MLPSIYLAPDALMTREGKLVGRQSAGTGFLRAFAQAYSGSRDRLQVIHTGEPETGWYQAQLSALGWHSDVALHDANEPESWPHGVLYYPAPIGTKMAGQRARQGLASMALCGVTHTISSIGVLQQIESLVSGPFTPWDALICTSNSVRRVVEEVLQAEKSRLARRLGVPMVLPRLPMLPVIPLGVHADDFVSRPEWRQQARANWGVSDREVVVLFVGRLSFHSKANPVAMYQACARAQKISGRTIRLVELGQFANDAVQRIHQQAAQACGVNPIWMNNRESQHLHQAYAGADVFMSLSDNIQESFGLTPLEAMASGLPVIVSDWDGYKETVRDGLEGFLIPTTQNGVLPSFQSISDHYVDGRLNYDLYVANAHLQVAVDVELCARRLAMLITNEALRRRMGAAGRARVRRDYDWPHVMRQYQALWQEQEEMRCGHRFDPPQRTPAASNPLGLFDHYPTRPLSAKTPLQQDPEALPAVGDLSMWAFARHRLKDRDTLWKARAMLPQAGQPVITLQDWAAGLGWSLDEAAWQAVYMLKIAWISIAAHSSEDS